MLNCRRRIVANEQENTYNFQKLTPDSDVELKVYEDAINYIFGNPDVRNVAISGAYGAGKSSLIASYRKKHKVLRFVQISLAHFEQTDIDGEIEINESVLEGKIINQLIHQIPAESIFQTNFKVKRKIKAINILPGTFLTMLFIMSMLHILIFEMWKGYVASLPGSWIKDFLGISVNQYSLIISGIIVAITLFIFLYSVIKLQKTKNIFRRVSLQGNDIEIFEESEESYFDKYLNEVLYLFENVDADVIVFEDMDRFDVNGIFERLREINTLVNIQLKKTKKQPLRFFYLLRDDIFVSKDRTKFFDYIIPVVPVVDSSNSYDQFISHFKEGGIYNQFDNNLLQGLSLYIDDMRVLKNIYNEFVIYYNRLNTTELNSNKMLAIITYKNLFPRDFSELQLTQGMVYTLFAKKEDFINTEIERLEALADDKKSEIEETRKEHATSIQELDDIYNAKRNRSNGYWGQQQEFQENYNLEYPRRKQAIENKLNNSLSFLEEELSGIKQEIVSIQSKQLYEIITRENIDGIFKITSTNEIGVENNFHEIKGSEYFDLLKYILRNGFIDETYADYMTYFYSNSLSRIDKTFLRSVTDKKAKEYTYKLKNPALIIDRLRPVDFEQEEILNFDLFEHLLKTTNNMNLLNLFIKQLRDNRNFRFIGEYFDTERAVSFYVKYLNLQWPEMFTFAIEGSSLTEKQIKTYSKYTLYYSGDDNLTIIDSDNALSYYISNNADYLNIDDPNIERLIHGFNLLNVSFVRISNANDELLHEVYSNSLYEINFDNLSTILKKFYQINQEEDIQHKNYSLVLSQPDSALINYVNDNIGIYIEVVLSSNNEAINDIEEAALKILNNEGITVEQKESYIKLLKTTVTSIDEVIDKNLWMSLLSEDLVGYTEKNIVDYFGENETIDSTLLSFINTDKSVLNFLEIKDIYGAEAAEEFFDASIVSSGLLDHKYREILTSLDFSYNVFDIGGIADDKLRIIIDEGIVPMNLDNLLFIRDNYSRQALYFIERNLDEYVDTITREAFVLDEVVEILNWDVSDDIKTKLLDFTSDSISVVNKEYSTVVIAHILKNNLESDDLFHLFVNYEKWNEDLMQIILGLAIDNIGLIIEDPKDVSNQLLKILIESSDLDYGIKVDLFISMLLFLSKAESIEYLDILGLAEYKKIFEERKRPRFEINIVNGKLLAAFKEDNWISDFQEDQNKDGYYKIIRNK